MTVVGINASIVCSRAFCHHFKEVKEVNLSSVDCVFCLCGLAVGRT